MILSPLFLITPEPLVSLEPYFRNRLLTGHDSGRAGYAILRAFYEGGTLTVPQYLVLRSETLPRNPGGKILKKHLRENLEWGTQLW